MREITKKYSNDEVTIIWQPHLCIHSKICWKEATGLPAVFKPAEKPWIQMEHSYTDRIIEQVNKCPSGALSYIMNNELEKQDHSISSETIVEIAENGPLLVYGNMEIKSKNGSTRKESKVTAFCRCGASNNKPYCDGSHVKSGFTG